MLCKVVIEAVGKPTYFDVDVVCEVRSPPLPSPPLLMHLLLTFAFC